MAECTGSIATLVELLQGKFSKAVMTRLCEPKTGLFPSPKEIHMECSCLDWATMCKHVAAALYGVGARLNERPELLFVLRGVDGNDLLTAEATALPAKAGRPAKVLDDKTLEDVFGIELASTTEAPGAPSRKPRTKAAAKPARAARTRSAAPAVARRKRR